MFEMHFSNFNAQQVILFQRDVEIPYDFHPDLPYIFRALLYRQVKDMNSFVLIVGNPRSSKSYCAMKIAEVLCERMGRKFDVERQLTFSDVKKFLIWSKDAVGDVFILDETGTSLSPDQFWSLQQRIMRRFAQTQGFRENILIWCLPSIVFIQKGFRFLTNYAIKTKKQGVVDVYKIVVDQLIGKGFPDRIETMSFGMISNETRERYEQMKKEWNDKDLENEIDWINQLEKPYERKFPYHNYLDAFNNGVIDAEELARHLQELGFKEDEVEFMTQNEMKKKEKNKDMEELRKKNLEMNIKLKEETLKELSSNRSGQNRPANWVRS